MERVPLRLGLHTNQCASGAASPPSTTHSHTRTPSHALQPLAGGRLHAQRAAHPGAVPLAPHPAQRRQAGCAPGWEDSTAAECLYGRRPPGSRPCPSLSRLSALCSVAGGLWCRSLQPQRESVPRRRACASAPLRAPIVPAATGNFMLLTGEEDSPLKAIDFGLAVFFDPALLPRTDLGLEGTPWWDGWGAAAG